MSTTTLGVSTPTVTSDINPHQGWEPSAKDRCDRCGAQAYMLLTKGKQALFLCGHHGKAHYEAAMKQGFNVLDFRSLLK